MSLKTLSTRVERIAKDHAPEMEVVAFWPADNGKGYYADQDGQRVPYSLEEIEVWSRDPLHQAIVVAWGNPEHMDVRS